MAIIFIETVLPAAPSHSSNESPPEGAITILVVDDDEILRELFASMLGDLGYRVFSAADGQAAMQIIAPGGGPKIDLLLTDYRMPFVMGDELALRFRQANPKAAIIVMSGESPALSPTLRCRFISKPFPIYSLGEIVADALAARAVE